MQIRRLANTFILATTMAMPALCWAGDKGLQPVTPFGVGGASGVDLSKLGEMAGNKMLSAAATPDAVVTGLCDSLGKNGLSDGFQIFAYSLTRDAAVSMSMWAEADIASSDRVVLYHFAWFRDNFAGDRSLDSRCGAGVMLALKVSGLNASTDLSLPTLAANAQLKQATIQYRLSTFGLSGKAINDAIPSATAIGQFNTESYAALMQSISKIQSSYTASSADLTVTPRLISVSAGKTPLLTTVAVQAYALRQVALGTTCKNAKNGVHQKSALTDSLVQEVYTTLGGSCQFTSGAPKAEVRDLAKSLLTKHGLMSV